MARPILDPTAVGSASGVSAVERLPRRVRAFGHYPDIQRLQPGDLILVAPLKRGLNAKAIERAQAETHGKADAQWIHAATYLGDNSLVEISWQGVRVIDLDGYVPTHKLLFRRALDLKGVEITEAEGLRVAVAALKQFKTKYAFRTIVDIGARALGGGANPVFSPREPAAICSDFYNDAVARVLSRGAASAKRNPFTPADLSASSNMTDIAVTWQTLP